MNRVLFGVRVIYERCSTPGTHRIRLMVEGAGPHKRRILVYVAGHDLSLFVPWATR